jgi:hypothetical protein
MDLNGIADTAVVRAGQLNDATNTIAAAGNLRVLRSAAAGNDACEVFVVALRN